MYACMCVHVCVGHNLRICAIPRLYCLFLEFRDFQNPKIAQFHSMNKNIQSNDIPQYPLVLCEAQILPPLQKMLPATPHHLSFPKRQELHSILRCTASLLGAITVFSCFTLCYGYKMSRVILC